MVVSTSFVRRPGRASSHLFDGIHVKPGTLPDCPKAAVLDVLWKSIGLRRVQNATLSFSKISQTFHNELHPEITSQNKNKYAYQK